MHVAAQRAEQILRAVRDHAFDVSGQSTVGHHEGRVLLPVTLSIGVAHLAAQAGDLRALYAEADGALYEAKRRGRHQVAVRQCEQIVAEDAPVPVGTARTA